MAPECGAPCQPPSGRPIGMKGTIENGVDCVKAGLFGWCGYQVAMSPTKWRPY